MAKQAAPAMGGGAADKTTRSDDDPSIDNLSRVIPTHSPEECHHKRTDSDSFYLKGELKIRGFKSWTAGLKCTRLY